MTQTAEEQTAKDKFSNAVSALLHPHDHSGRSLKNFILRHAHRYHLNGVEPWDILSQAILQGLEKTQKTGQEIYNPVAWLRVAILGILKNQVRDNIRQESLAEKVKVNNPLMSKSPMQTIELDDLLLQYYEVVKSLSDEDREILGLFFNQGKSYEEIQAYYERKDGNLLNLPTIRKRVSRSKERVIKALHQLDFPLEKPQTSSKIETNKNCDHSLPP